MRYEFGKNWSEFIEKNFSEERIKIAQDCLLNFLKLGDLRERTFLDIGCGSGIHSLAAYRSGAKRIVSFDYDPDSVNTTRKVRELTGSPNNWEVLQGSVLDRSFVDKLDRADIVYSWGVLHHTGNMWEAVKNAWSTMNQDGVYYIALYTKDIFIHPTPEFWLAVKKRYNRGRPLTRKCMEWAYAFKILWPELRAARNPFVFMQNYDQSRGMSFWTDVKDWLGGWPMEFAGIAETKEFCSKKLGLELLNIRAGEANTEYLFRKKRVKNYWDDFALTQKMEHLAGPFVKRRGHAWVAQLQNHAETADTMEFSKRSRLMLYEEGVPLGFAHAAHGHIETYGNGRYSHWGNELIFSSTDNTDPNCNGRRYSVCASML